MPSLLSLIASFMINVGQYQNIDPGHIIPDRPLKIALAHFDNRKSDLTNTRYLGIVDFSKHNSAERFFLVNMQTGSVETFVVAHGRGSDPFFNGYATKFSNIEGSRMSSLGLYKTGETYHGSYGYSLRLEGLEKINSNISSRGIVLHGFDYIKKGLPINGWSSGCLAVERNVSEKIIEKLKGGALIYAWYSQ